MSPPRTKTALVTVGATAPFPALVRSAIDPAVRSALSELGYTHLRIQHGLNEGNWGESSVEGRELLQSVSTAMTAGDEEDGDGEGQVGSSPGRRVVVSGFDFVESMREEVAGAELVISHAGSGSILDALRQVKRLIVVPNTALMDNHQVELAQELQRQGYLVEARPEPESLQAAIRKAAVTEFKHFPKPEGEKFARIVEEEAGLMALD
ncbi:glycosyl transferase [Kalaharituber pfeilii]|nr:glycosyl transferase [Kalaharituber pfeilii]